MNIKTFVFLDLETTGLPVQQNNQTKITELCLVTVQSEHILLGAVPRVQNKLNLCFNPWKLIVPVVEDITGLSNELLEYQSSFDDKTLTILINFLERLQKPICFVAHNGYGFDYPILKYHIEKLKKEFLTHVFCVDSLEAFRIILAEPEVKNDEYNSSSSDLSDEWDNSLVKEVCVIENRIGNTSRNITDIQRLNETTPVKRKTNHLEPEKNLKHKAKNKLNLNSYFTPYSREKQPVARKRLDFDKNSQPFKLVNIYQKLIQRKPENAHHAESDVKMMLECAVFLGDKFVNWANDNAKLFTEVARMQPKVIKS